MTALEYVITPPPLPLVKIDYTNWRGVRRERTIQPTGLLRFESSAWHPQLQWILYAIDVEDNIVKGFAMKDIHSWNPLA